MGDEVFVEDGTYKYITHSRKAALMISMGSTNNLYVKDDRFNNKNQLFVTTSLSRTRKFLPDPWICINFANICL